MLAVPAATPATIPDEAPTVAIPVFPLVHVPLVVASLRAVVRPKHTLMVPVIGGGIALMEIFVVA